MTRWLLALLLMVAVSIMFANEAPAQLVPQKFEPYKLPEKALEGLTKLAGESDVLVLGETHGTQETPAVAAALLAPLDKLGYKGLALEIPAHEQQPLVAWAMGKTETVPRFFAQPFDDGRGNIQALALIRTALSPPYRWRLICFDEPWDFALGRVSNAEQPIGVQKLRPEDAAADWVRGDSAMAAQLAQARAKLGGAKVLAICGSFHARTSRGQLAGKPGHKPPDDPTDKFWPSFAAALASQHADWRVRSVRIVPHGGAFFASVSSDDGPPRAGIHSIRSKLKLDEAEAHALEGKPFDWELNLPLATPATFLAPPTGILTD